jgi:hypothetical protein
MATTETVGSSVEQIPYVALEELGKIFFEGQNKYGVGNWKDNPSPSYRLERLRHAIRHLFLFAEHDTSEKHLAKVLWFCVTELFLESKYGPLRSFSSRELYPDAKHKTTITPLSEFTKPIDDLQKFSTKNVDVINAWMNPTAENLNKVFDTGSVPTGLDFKYSQLLAEFESYKLFAQQEVALLNEQITRLRDRVKSNG